MKCKPSTCNCNVGTTGRGPWLYMRACAENARGWPRGCLHPVANGQLEWVVFHNSFHILQNFKLLNSCLLIISVGFKKLESSIEV